MSKNLLKQPELLFIVIMLTGCQNPRKNAAISSDPGARLFLQYCSNCHLSNGSGGQIVPGGDMAAVDIRTFTKTVPELSLIIKNGYGKMPAFGDSISAENITVLAKYVAEDIEYKKAK